jgi:predicted LPLAT superfamily acyltransferase
MGCTHLLDTFTFVYNRSAMTPQTHPLSPCMWPSCPLVADHGLFVEIVLIDGSRHREHLHFCFQHYPKFTKLTAHVRAGIVTAYLDHLDQLEEV